MLAKGQSLFVVDLEYVVPFEQIEPLLDAHMAFVTAQYEAGHFLASGPKVPRTGGVILAQADRRETLETILATDPFVEQNVATCTVTEFKANGLADGLL